MEITSTGEEGFQTLVACAKPRCQRGKYPVHRECVQHPRSAAPAWEGRVSLSRVSPSMPRSVSVTRMVSTASGDFFSVSSLAAEPSAQRNADRQSSDGRLAQMGGLLDDCTRVCPSRGCYPLEISSVPESSEACHLRQADLAQSKHAYRAHGWALGSAPPTGELFRHYLCHRHGGRHWGIIGSNFALHNVTARRGAQFHQTRPH